ncbi:serine/threonine-protein kinase/endoribonuclease IRE2-like isoform X2 [Xenia sp. Carnegie-2017]|uniref:serine/threonine-protein kinase/endoribonuclease IRE2-like isoform X2 n=1 Tax=Xenia sp. Carnegie-2017 TaxID=2897299 RepID=UPI001F03CEFD|nr:serine/threonine-protein kinase/endoribonuclease IRE2-like isoform X2 [Xenia sp. Carnegie-2017]
MALINYNEELESKELQKKFERLPLTKSSSKDDIAAEAKRSFKPRRYVAIKIFKKRYPKERIKTTKPPHRTEGIKTSKPPHRTERPSKDFASAPGGKPTESYKPQNDAEATFKDDELSKPWKCIDKSKMHEEMLRKLEKYWRENPTKFKFVNGVLVIFSEEFLLGKGSDGARVYLALGKDGYGKAVKRLLQDSCTELAKQEKDILIEFNAKRSNYVVSWYLEEESGAEYTHLVLDLCEESLESFVESSTFDDLQKALPTILKQILKGLADLHSGPCPILHRDLRPSNVLRDVQGNFLIADFGISRILSDETSTHRSIQRGAKNWIAPESYDACDASIDKARYNKQSDVMNAGMVAYYVATKGKHPFGHERLRLDNILKGNPVGLDEIEDATLKDLLSWMLQLKPEDRPLANEALKHPFLMSDDVKFEMLCKVGNQRPIKINDVNSSVVQHLNSEPSDWKSRIHHDAYDYFCTDKILAWL